MSDLKFYHFFVISLGLVFHFYTVLLHDMTNTIVLGKTKTIVGDLVEATVHTFTTVFVYCPLITKQFDCKVHFFVQ